MTTHRIYRSTAIKYCAWKLLKTFYDLAARRFFCMCVMQYRWNRLDMGWAGLANFYADKGSTGNVSAMIGYSYIWSGKKPSKWIARHFSNNRWGPVCINKTFIRIIPRYPSQYTRVSLQRRPIWCDTAHSMVVIETECKSEYKLTKDTPYLVLLGGLWGVCCVDLGRKLSM